MAGRPEVFKVESDVFDPTGGDRMVVHGRLLGSASDLRVGTTVAPGLGITAFADLDGVNDRLAATGTLDTYLAPAAHSGWAVIYVDAINTNVAAVYDNDALITTIESVFFGVFLKDNAGARTVHLYQWDGADKSVSTSIATGAWQLVQWKYDGVNLKLRVNNGAWASGAAGSITDLASAVRVGMSRTATGAFLDGRIAEMALTDIALSDATMDSVAGYVTARYGVATGQGPNSFDPTTLALTGLWRSGGYVSGTWSGTASAGGSGTRTLTEATNPPAVVTSEHIGMRESMIGVPDFDGVNDRLLPPGADIGTYYSTAAYSGWALVKIDAVNTDFDDTQPFANDAIIATTPSGYWSLTLRKSGRVQAQHYTNTAIRVTVSAPFAIGEYQLVQWKYDGTNVKVRVLGNRTVGEWVSAAAANQEIQNTFRLGINYDASHLLDGRIAELALTNVALSDATLDDVVKYVNEIYGLTLGDGSRSTFDPTTLVLQGYWRRTGYVVGTWTGVASGGGSGTRNATEATNPPSVADSDVLICTAPAKSAGVTLGALANYDGATDLLTAALTRAQLLGSAGWSFSCLVRPTDLSLSAGQYRQIWTESGQYVDLVILDDGRVLLGQYNAAGGIRTTVTSVGRVVIGEWNRIEARWTGTTSGVIEVRVNGVGWTSAAQSEIGGGAGTFIFGRHYTAAGFYKGDMAYLLFADSVLTNAQFDNIYSAYLGGSFSLASLSLTGYWKPASYVAGTWTGTASAGASGGRNLTEGVAANQPAVATDRVVPTPYPVAVKNATGWGSLANAVKYMTPKTLPNCVWWLDSSLGVTVNGSNEVTNWADQSGAADANRDAIAATAGLVPKVNSDPDYGGKPSIGPFRNATDRRLKTGAWTGGGFEDPYTINAVGHTLAGAGNRYFTTREAGTFNAILNSNGAPTAYGSDNLLVQPPDGSAVSLARIRSSSAVIFVDVNGAMHVGVNRTPGTGDLEGATTPLNLGSSAVAVGSHPAGGSVDYGCDRLVRIAAWSRALTIREIRDVRRRDDSYYGPVAA